MTLLHYYWPAYT